MTSKPTYVEANIAIAAYLLLKGKVLLEVSIPPKRSFEFIFEDADNTCMAVAKEYLNTDFRKFDSHLQDLRDRVRIAQQAKRGGRP